MKAPKLTCVEGKLWIVEEPTGLGKYDFDFGATFACRHPAWLDEEVVAVARMGATPDYAARYAELLGFGVRLIHTPEEYARASTLPEWYPLLEGLTPRSVWFDAHPTAEDLERELDYPMFLKGERQTNRHSRAQSIIEGPEQLRHVLSGWAAEPILGWQRVVAREFLALRPAGEDLGVGLPVVFEFRSFWWGEECVGIGPYWSAAGYRLSARERADAVALGREAARRVGVGFLVVDLAQTVGGDWVVIECNDGQDSGYMGVDRRAVWRAVLDMI
jgi:hypothetical protein